MSDYPFRAFGDEFKDKRVLVTGGTKGMGVEIVRRFQLSGARVATTARARPSQMPSSLLFIAADMATPAGVKDVVTRIQHEWNGLDILVNNVGGTETKP